MVTKEILKYGNRSVVEVRDDLGQIKKYVTCTNYDATKEYGNQWIWGHYYDVWENGKEEEMLKGAIMELYEVKTEEKNQTIPPIRMQEIAEKVISFIKSNLDTDDVRDYLEDAELTEEEPAAEVRYADRIGNYLFQPAKAIRKAGAFRLLSARFGVAKLAPSTHLYTADTPATAFPGKRFVVEDVLPWGNAARQELRRRFDRVELTALNFPMTTDALRKRLGIPDGGDRHVFATTLNNDKVLIICQP